MHACMHASVMRVGVQLLLLVLDSMPRSRRSYHSCNQYVHSYSFVPCCLKVLCPYPGLAVVHEGAAVPRVSSLPLCRRLMSEAVGSLVETLSSTMGCDTCDALPPAERSTLCMSSLLCPEAVLQHAFHALTEQYGRSETYMLWLKDWCVFQVHRLCCHVGLNRAHVLESFSVFKWGRSCVSRIEVWSMNVEARETASIKPDGVSAGWLETKSCRSCSPQHERLGDCLHENLRMAMQTGI
jgi:hypothetical protein